MNGITIGVLALAAGGAAWAIAHKSTAKSQADSGRAATIAMFRAASTPAAVRDVAQQALDSIYAESGGNVGAPTPGISDADSSAYLGVIYAGSQGLPALDYVSAVQALDTLWQDKAYYEASTVVDAIATDFGGAS